MRGSPSDKSVECRDLADFLLIAEQITRDRGRGTRPFYVPVRNTQNDSANWGLVESGVGGESDVVEFVATVSERPLPIGVVLAQRLAGRRQGEDLRSARTVSQSGYCRARRVWQSRSCGWRSRFVLISVTLG